MSTVDEVHDWFGLTFANTNFSARGQCRVGRKEGLNFARAGGGSGTSSEFGNQFELGRRLRDFVIAYERAALIGSLLRRRRSSCFI